jgi:formate--tetrahydrofolate ligase
VAALGAGHVKIGRHIDNVKKYGLPVVVAINGFSADTNAENDAVLKYCAEKGVKAAVCTHWANGGAGAEDLARLVVDAAESGAAKFKPLYPDDMKLAEKARTIAREIYGAADIFIDGPAEAQLTQYEDDGFGNFPICMAKTQYSFSTDPAKKGAPSGHTVEIREVRLSAGAEFIVAICGDIMTMPGLPKGPAAEAIGLNAEGEVVGLF